ncbi:hypothetical protein [Brevundimonas abyssalis]|jgi:hypothetical protein|uniref:Uncharacterized protein n=1 Tax=Brevundimonas abyssalis TAR-001 TaxID=1391729 RepID=A0A8E0NAI3_9CAUL|nr:hypothetical protein [Brevundimonas abyssalis]GAD58093.1 hypothetical protein MBEBAB_0343 [Brevundimonas abyssalis TAR-001]
MQRSSVAELVAEADDHGLVLVIAIDGRESAGAELRPLLIESDLLERGLQGDGKITPKDVETAVTPGRDAFI